MTLKQYKIKELEGNVVLLISLTDEDNTYYTNFRYKLEELEGILEKVFVVRPTLKDIEKLIKEYAINKANSIICSYDVDDIGMIVVNEYGETVDYMNMDLNWFSVEITDIQISKLVIE